MFATFTAPSFGPVHTRPVRRHTCADRDHCRCKPEPCHARRDAGTCPHGQPLACFPRHAPGDDRARPAAVPGLLRLRRRTSSGTPAAGELWRRTKQDIERHLVHLARRRGLPSAGPRRTAAPVPPIRVSHGKAAEYQARGAVHFHVLLRLDGTDPADPDARRPAACRDHRRRP